MCLNYKRWQPSQLGLWALLTPDSDMIWQVSAILCILCRLELLAKAHEHLPAVTTGILDQKIPRCCRPYTVFERPLVVCDWALIEVTSITDGHKIIMKPEMPIMSWVMLEKHSNERSAQKCSIIKREMVHPRARCQGNAGRHPLDHEHVASFPLGPTLEPPEELLEPTGTWSCPVDGSQLNHKAQLLYGWQFQDEWIVTCLESGCIKTRGWRDSDWRQREQIGSVG